MLRSLFLSALALALLAAGCATSAGEVKVKQEIPKPEPGEVAVFGGTRLVEEIGVFLPNQEQDGHVYLRPDAEDDTLIKISCSDSGAFGVYLSPGGYKVEKVTVDGYTFRPEISLAVPKGYKAIYTGVIELDGTPSGVDRETGDTVFVYSILDESGRFVDELRRKAPGSERDVYKSLFRADGSLSTGNYPTKVFRADDLKNDLGARSDAVEEVVKGGIVALTYCINPVWLFTLP